MKGANNSYFGSIREAISTSITGVKLTIKHLKDAAVKKRQPAITANDENYFAASEGIVTLNYPHETIPVPDNGRYQLHNEMDDCIVCDKCAKICPVNCIDIEPIKSTEVIGETSDGTSKRLYAAKFDIDMAKCCFCGLCTTVCPTECLTMTKEYDFSVFEIDEMNFEFATLTPAEAQEKQALYDKQQEEKRKAKLEAQKKAEEAKPQTEEPQETSAKKSAFKPKFKPKMGAKKPAVSSVDKDKLGTKSEGTESKPKPKFRPKIKPKAIVKKVEEVDNKDQVTSEEKVEKPKPKFRPKIKPKIAKKKDDEDEA